MDAGLDVALTDAPAQALMAVFARGTTWFDAARPARQPRVEHHPLADFQPTCRRAQRNNVGHHLMAHHLREGTESGHRVVGVTLAEVEQDLLGVGPADARKAGPGDHPILVQRLRIRYLA